MYSHTIDRSTLLMMVASKAPKPSITSPCTRTKTQFMRFRFQTICATSSFHSLAKVGATAEMSLRLWFLFVYRFHKNYFFARFVWSSQSGINWKQDPTVCIKECHCWQASKRCHRYWYVCFCLLHNCSARHTFSKVTQACVSVASRWYLFALWRTGLLPGYFGQRWRGSSFPNRGGPN